MCPFLFDKRPPVLSFLISILQAKDSALHFLLPSDRLLCSFQDLPSKTGSEIEREQLLSSLVVASLHWRRPQFPLLGTKERSWQKSPETREPGVRSQDLASVRFTGESRRTKLRAGAPRMRRRRPRFLSCQPGARGRVHEVLWETVTPPPQETTMSR